MILKSMYGSRRWASTNYVGLIHNGTVYWADRNIRGKYNDIFHVDLMRELGVTPDDLDGAFSISWDPSSQSWWIGWIGEMDEVAVLEVAEFFIGNADFELEQDDDLSLLAMYYDEPVALAL